MSTLKQLGSEIGRALAVLSMLFLCLAATPPDLPAASVVQQAGAIGTLFTGLCGSDHGQPQLACHAPNVCCRPDLGLLPPRAALAGPAFRAAIAVAYALLPAPADVAAASAPFRSRAPPV